MPDPVSGGAGSPGSRHPASATAHEAGEAARSAPPDMPAVVGPSGATFRRLEAVPRRPRNLLLVLAEVVIILGVWELLQGVLKLADPIFLPPPSKILAAIVRLTSDGTMLMHAGASLQNFALGYFIAAATGVVFGLAIGGTYVLGRLVGPLAWALYAMPLIAIRPMTTIWFGFGNAPIIFLVFLSAMLPVLLNTMSGVRTVDRSLLRAAAVFGAGPITRYRKIILPATIPFVLTGLRLAVVSGFIGLLASELHGAPRGFGALMAIARSRFRVDDAFATIVVLVAISVSIVRLVGIVERQFSSWRTTARA